MIKIEMNIMFYNELRYRGCVCVCVCFGKDINAKILRFRKYKYIYRTSRVL